MTTIYQQPTICAIATPIGRGGVGVIRLSGKNAKQIAKNLTHRQTDFVPRHAHFCRFYDKNGVILDEGLVLFLCTSFVYWRRCGGATRTRWGNITAAAIGTLF